MLRWETVSPLLKKCLLELMSLPALNQHRLVGGTALSLYLGHRISVDIDLFADPGVAVDYPHLEAMMETLFPYFENRNKGPVSFGRSYLIGDSAENNIKLDIYFAVEPFIRPVYEVDGVRMATVADIAAMKADVIQRGGRQKDFWDVHEMLDQQLLSVTDIIALHKERYPYMHDEPLLLQQFTNFAEADNDFTPECLRGKHWEMIKYEIIEAVNLL